MAKLTILFSRTTYGTKVVDIPDEEAERIRSSKKKFVERRRFNEAARRYIKTDEQFRIIDDGIAWDAEEDVAFNEAWLSGDMAAR